MDVTVFGNDLLFPSLISKYGKNDIAGYSEKIHYIPLRENTLTKYISRSTVLIS